MFTIDDSFIDFEVGKQAVHVLFEELGEDFLNSYKKIKDLVMQKRIGQDYLLSRKVTCSHPKFMENHPNVDVDTFCLLTTDLVIRGEAILLMLRKQTGIDVMKRYNEIKKSINKKKRNNGIRNNQLCLNEFDEKKSEGLALAHFFPFIKNSATKIVERLIYCIKQIYSIFSEHFLNRILV